MSLANDAEDELLAWLSAAANESFLDLRCKDMKSSNKLGLRRIIPIGKIK